MGKPWLVDMVAADDSVDVAEDVADDDAAAGELDVTVVDEDTVNDTESQEIKPVVVRAFPIDETVAAEAEQATVGEVAAT